MGITINPNREIESFGGNEANTADELHRRPLALVVGDRTVSSDDVETIYRCAQAPGRRDEARATLGAALGRSGPVSNADLADFLRLLDDTLVRSAAPDMPRQRPGQLTVATFDASVLTTLTDGRDSYGAPKAVPLDAAFTQTAGGASLRGATRVAVPPTPPNASAVVDVFRGGAMIYSQNFGILDPHHIGHFANVYRDVYQAALRSIGPPAAPQTVPVVCGNRSTHFPTAYTLAVTQRAGESREQAADRVAREICVNIGVRYEEHTNIGVNAYLPGPIGTSAFSTEDLPSNTLGMEAGAAYLRGDGVRPGESLDDFALRWASSRGGSLYWLHDSDTAAPAGAIRQQRSANDNKTCLPKYPPNAPRRENAPDLYRVFGEADRIRRSHEGMNVEQPDAARGWHLSNPGPSLLRGTVNRIFS